MPSTCNFIALGEFDVEQSLGNTFEYDVILTVTSVISSALTGLHPRYSRGVHPLGDCGECEVWKALTSLGCCMIQPDEAEPSDYDHYEGGDDAQREALVWSELIAAAEHAEASAGGGGGRGGVSPMTLVRPHAN